MPIEIKPAYRDIEAVKELFGEYTNMLIETDARFNEYLDFQGYESELENLDKKYGPPGGRLYIALFDGKAAGCIALRPLDEERCEMKRLYVRPEFRGNGIAKAMIEMLIHDAIHIGYRSMLLDTLPALKDALKTYAKFGFYEIPSYNDSPVNGAIFLRLDLKTVS